MRLPVLALIVAFYSIAAPATESVPKAVIADPPPDAKFPARMEVIHVPSGGVSINGVVYVASGEPLAIDPTRVAIGGHSMGGWVSAETLAHDSNLLGAVLISAGVSVRLVCGRGKIDKP